MIANSPGQPAAASPWLNWLTQRPGVVLAFLWGLAEGTLFFILPDVLLSLAALFRPRHALTHLVAIIAGALVGGAIMFSWASRGPAARHAVAGVPLVTPRMFATAEQDYRASGAWAVCKGPIRGIPYKVYAVQAPEHCRLPIFLTVTIPARGWRLLGDWLFFAGVGHFLRKSGRGSLALAIHVAIWTLVYLVYWATVK